ncbi:MAG: ABC transporter permease [Actinomycetia bacterium]|nr:ABC transporter permease [Actinomycetes bacterium]MCP5034933.1 ABC transporter permease [Actinomycetes bacterium]
MSAVLAVTRHQLRIVRSDPAFLAIMFLMPLAIMPLMRRSLGVNLEAAGFSGADGAEQVVPGQIVLFGFFVAGNAAFALFREHGWRTWDRIRASATSPASLLAGFALPWVLIHVVYQVALLLAGALFFGLRLNGGSVIAVGMTLLAFSYCSITLVLLAAATFRTVNQVQALVNVGAMVFGGIGGALVPLESLPGWAQAIAPFTPHYWAMKSHRQIFLEAGGIADVAIAFAVLLAIGTAAMIAGARRFRTDETKEFFA